MRDYRQEIKDLQYSIFLCDVGSIMLGIVSPILLVTYHLNFCEFCSQTGLNMVCLSICLAPTLLGKVFYEMGRDYRKRLVRVLNDTQERR